MYQSVPPGKIPLELRWRTETPNKGESWSVITRGPHVGVHCHWSGAYRPCRARLTNGALGCNRCKQQGIRWVGYVPVWKDNVDHSLVLSVTQSAAEILEATPAFTPLYVMRGIGCTKALKIGPQRATGVNLSVLNWLKSLGESDIRPYLLHLWQDRELTTFFGLTFTPSTATISGKHDQRDADIIDSGFATFNRINRLFPQGSNGHV